MQRSQTYTSVPLLRRIGLSSCSLLFAACAISTQREVDMGEDFAAQVNRQLRLVRDAEVVRYINVLGDSLAAIADDRGLDWTFHVVDSKEVNAFAAPGGYIWINRGLIERTTNMAQLAGVIAHEIGHVTMRHSIQQMQTSQRANVGLTLACILTNVCDYGITNTAVQLGGGALFAKFSRDDETEADRVAVQYVTRAGIDPRGIPEMFRILLKEREERPAGMQGWFSTHPLEEDRVRASEADIARLPAASLRGLRADSERFQQFRRRVIGLPTVATR
ncbi:MAG: M48 family metalloprotease [Gemmatimonadetes bacterium]|nr:M48 family metalloprotease [Gemmatimonadota bacterium]